MLFLKNYDHVVVMAYPYMEKAQNPVKWLQKLVRQTEGIEAALDKTVFKLQAFDWEQKQWIDSRELLDQMREILAAGGRHLAYYPDNLWEDQPTLKNIKLEMSTYTFPYLR